MDYFGINTPEDLPKIKEVLADQLVSPTVVNHTEFEQSEVLAVSDTGELILADEPEGEVEEPQVNGHSFDIGVEESEEKVNGDEEENETIEDLPSETLADEIAEEDFITDEIFAAEEEVTEEEKIEEELAGDTDLPEADNSSEEEDDQPPTDNDENKA
jgi:segregation and condensation protein B